MPERPSFEIYTPTEPWHNILAGRQVLWQTDSQKLLADHEPNNALAPHILEQYTAQTDSGLWQFELSEQQQSAIAVLFPPNRIIEVGPTVLSFILASTKGERDARLEGRCPHNLTEVVAQGLEQPHTFHDLYDRRDEVTAWIAPDNGPFYAHYDQGDNTVMLRTLWTTTGQHTELADKLAVVYDQVDTSVTIVTE